MSTLQVKVTTIDEVKPHPNADRLDIAIVGGWQCIVPKDTYQSGDKIVYFPPDTILPPEWIERFNVGNYTSHGRIRQARLRGEPSFGLVVQLDDPSWEVGQDVAEYYGATKYEPPPRTDAGDAEVNHPLFVAYTEIENLRDFMDVFLPDEQVIATEKIHGTNARVGYVQGVRMAGSRHLRRKEPADYSESIYWFPWRLPEVVTMLDELHNDHEVVILYGEIFGRGVQKLQYGQTGLAFYAFDLSLDGKYLAYPEFKQLCDKYAIATVPEVTTASFAEIVQTLKTISSGKSLVPRSNHIREGIVLRPYAGERMNPKIGRVILKYVSDDYLLGKNEDNTDV